MIKQLMQARMAARAAADEAGQKAAAKQVHAAKVALGEAGPVWWTDGAEDVSGLAPDATTYADWWATVADKRSGE